jgi:excisionase family DNA binding protein
VSTVAAHLHRAIEAHRRWCRDQAIPVPPELDQLLSLVSGGQGLTEPPPVLRSGDDPGMPLALTFDDAGRLLEVSARTIKRLVDAGKIRSISVGHAPRIPREEIERFIADQLEVS